MSKKFGQNFLLSRPVRERIVSSLDLKPGMKVWEIGPGIGAITSLILNAGADLTAFEIDHGFCRILSTRAFAEDANFHLVEGDAMKTLLPMLENEVPDRLCGNLPYNVGSVLIGKVLESGKKPPLMVFTLQKEVVDRLCATPGSKDWSSFSILGQMDYQVKSLFTISSGSFYPMPNVVSSTVLFKVREQSLVSDERRTLFLTMVRDLFAQRRKTVKNNLSASPVSASIGKERVAQVLEGAGIDPSRRAETLNWEELLRLSELLSSYQAK